MRHHNDENNKAWSCRSSFDTCSCSCPPDPGAAAGQQTKQSVRRDHEDRDEITNEALFRACRAYGLGEQFNAAAQDEGTFAEWLDELPIEVAAATARLLKHHARSGAWIEIHPGSPSQRASRPRALAATATAALTRARTAYQTCRSRPTVATSTPLSSPRNPRSHTVHACVMHAL